MSDRTNLAELANLADPILPPVRMHCEVCHAPATTTLYRQDKDDPEGTDYCDQCAGSHLATCWVCGRSEPG